MAGEDDAYRAAVTRLPCSMCQRPGPNQCHHAKQGTGKGQRAHDHRSMSLCLRCHHDRHALSGSFKGWTRDRIREWEDIQIGKTWFAIKGTWDGCPLYQESLAGSKQVDDEEVF